MLTNPCKGLFHLKRRKYKRIYEIANEISCSIQGPKIHEIYISNDLNAGATSRRFLGLFKRNILILGYPAPVFIAGKRTWSRKRKMRTWLADAAAFCLIDGVRNSFGNRVY